MGRNRTKPARPLNKKKTKRQSADMRVRVSAEHESTIRTTIEFLHSREHEKNVDRDAEFVKFLRRVHRDCASTLRPEYEGATQETFQICADEVYNFKGVSKDVSGNDGVLKHYVFDREEGKSWADQRRAKWIVPMCIGWLDAIVNEVHQLASVGLVHDTTNFLTEIIVRLLTTSYHPNSRQSNATQLVCTQTMHHKQFRARLYELTAIDLPRPKEQIAKWLNRVRQEGYPLPEESGSVSSTAEAEVQRLSYRVEQLERLVAEQNREILNYRTEIERLQFVNSNVFPPEIESPPFVNEAMEWDQSASHFAPLVNGEEHSAFVYNGETEVPQMPGIWFDGPIPAFFPPDSTFSW